MSQVKKLADTDLTEIKSLQNKFQEIIYKFGQLQIEKLEIDKIVSEFIDKEKSLKDEWSSLQAKDKILIEKIINTYGEGNLNLTEGTLTIP